MPHVQLGVLGRLKAETHEMPTVEDFVAAANENVLCTASTQVAASDVSESDMFVLVALGSLPDSHARSYTLGQVYERLKGKGCPFRVGFASVGKSLARLSLLGLVVPDGGKIRLVSDEFAPVRLGVRLKDIKLMVRCMSEQKRCSTTPELLVAEL